MSHKSKNLRDQAAGLATNVGDALGPRLEEAREQAGPLLTEARTKLTDEVLPAVQSALADAREQAAPHVAEARTRLTEDVLPAVQSALADAREQAGPVAQEARRRGQAAAEALVNTETDQTGGKKGKKKWLLLLAVLGGAAVAAKKVLDRGTSHAGHAATTPPRPTPVAEADPEAEAGVPLEEEFPSDPDLA